MGEDYLEAKVLWSNRSLHTGDQTPSEGKTEEDAADHPAVIQLFCFVTGLLPGGVIHVCFPL